MTDRTPLAPYDGLLLHSFGGPEGPDDVMPFLRNVTAGRGIPDERLREVAHHYDKRGGRSPINDENRALIAGLTRELTRRGVDVPVFWGNKFWSPYTHEALAQARDAGVRRLLTVVTSAYSSYSGCRSYREDLAAALERIGGGLEIDVLRPYGHTRAFREPTRRHIVEAFRALLTSSALQPSEVTVLFVTHSIPVAMNDSSGPPGEPGVYQQQHLQVCDDVMSAVRAQCGVDVPWQLTYCSRSGPPSQPWLEPDVSDAVAQLADSGVRGVLIAPIGFVSDHMEVVHDLDEEAVEAAQERGLAVSRVSTVRDDPVFVAGLVDLLLARAAAERDARPKPGLRCPAGCCAGRGPAKPTVSEEA